MSLRDQFAREAMNGILSNGKIANSEYVVIAHQSYKIADAMLKERERGRGRDSKNQD